MKSMKMFLFSAALVLVASSNVQVTKALLFNGGGYTIGVVIGFLDDPVIAQVRFTPPGAKDWVSLPRDLLRN
jgi:ABC-type sugar transport system substrate-binding protein